ncbi:MAG: T9SS type A sorting domain-containing protein, partial [Bacteroidia bacterium]
KPEITVLGADQYFCPGSTVNLVASGANSYSWNGVVFNDSITFLATNDSIIQVIGFGDCGFVDTLDLQINVFQAVNDTVHSYVSFCYGANATITSPILGQTYLWQDGTTAADFNFLCLKDTLFYCFVNISGGCSTYEAIHVTVIAPANVTISGNTQVCNGESTQLRADGAISYLWENNYPGKYFHVFLTVDSVISVVGIDSNGCQDTVSVLVVLLPTFDYIIDGPSIICNPFQNFQIESSIPFVNFYTLPGYTYVWSTGATTSGILGLTATSPEVSVTVTNSNGCVVTKSKAVQVLNGGDLFAKDTLSVCQGQTIVLKPDTIAPYVSYNWGSGWFFTNTKTITANVDTLIILLAQTSSGCIVEDTLLIDVKSNISLSVTGNTTLCRNSIGTWTANTNSSNVQWIFPGSQYFNGNSVSFAPTLGGTIQITASDTSGCSVSVNKTFTLVNNTISLNDSAYLCAGDTTKLEVTGGNSWTWSTGATTNSILVNPPSDSVYSVVVNNSGCTGTYVVKLFVSDSLTVSILGDSATCRNEPANLFVNAGTSWVWSTGQHTPSIVLPAGTPDGPVFVTVKFYDGCYGTGAIYHYNYPSLPLQIVGDTLICNGSSTALTATQGYASYQWNTSATSQSIVVPVGQSGIYGLAATDYAGCIYSDSVQVGFTTQPGFLSQNQSTFNCTLNQGAILTIPINTQDSIQWQYSNLLNGVYSNLLDGFQFNGVHSSTLQILDVNAFNGKYFRCKLFSDCFAGPTISDSIQFNIVQQVSYSQTASICGNELFYVGFVAHNQTGIYVDTLISHLGCDSIVTTNLTVNSIMINTQITVNDTQLIAPSGYSAYQWYNCITGNPIIGANTAIYNAQPNSNIYVIISSANCSDTSECFFIGTTGTIENFQEGTIKIIPNPFHENFTIQFSEPHSSKIKITLYNNLGQILMNKFVNESSIVIPGHNLQSGLYFLKVESGNRVSYLKVLKVD